MYPRFYPVMMKVIHDRNRGLTIKKNSLTKGDPNLFNAYHYLCGFLNRPINGKDVPISFKEIDDIISSNLLFVSSESANRVLANIKYIRQHAKKEKKQIMSLPDGDYTRYSQRSPHIQGATDRDLLKLAVCFDSKLNSETKLIPSSRSATTKDKNKMSPLEIIGFLNLKLDFDKELHVITVPEIKKAFNSLIAKHSLHPNSSKFSVINKELSSAQEAKDAHTRSIEIAFNLITETQSKLVEFIHSRRATFSFTADLVAKEQYEKGLKRFEHLLLQVNKSRTLAYELKEGQESKKKLQNKLADKIKEGDELKKELQKLMQLKKSEDQKQILASKLKICQVKNEKGPQPTNTSKP